THYCRTRQARLIWNELMRRFRGVEGVEQGSGFGEDFFGFCRGEGPAEDALRGELGSALGVTAYQLHQSAGVYGCGGGVGAAVGEFDVEHFDEGLRFVRADTLFDLGSLTVDLGDA